MVSLFYILLALLAIAGILLFPFWVHQWVEHHPFHSLGKKQIDPLLMRKIHHILSRASLKEQVIVKLKQLLSGYGYKLSYENSDYLLFKPSSLFSFRQTIRIDLTPYGTKEQYFNLLRRRAEAAIYLLTKTARLEGSLSLKESRYIKRIAERFAAELHPPLFPAEDTVKLRTYLIQVQQEAEKNSSISSHYAQTLQNHTYAFKSRLLRQMADLAFIDGLSPSKEHFILSTASLMGIPHTSIRQYIHARYRHKRTSSSHRSTSRTGHIPRHYQILGCSPSDDNATIKKRYRALVKRFHPDLVASGGGDGLTEILAKQKLQEINLAYEKVKKERKM